MLHCLSNFALAVEPVTAFRFNPVIGRWYIIGGAIALAAMLYYLYSVQSQIASRRIVRWLTAIRISLIVLLALLLMRPLYTLTRNERVGETLWVVLDQSLSMGQKDSYATPLEHLRWADALGLLPPDSRPVKLDRSLARLRGLSDELLNFQRKQPIGGDDTESAKLTGEYIDRLKTWTDNLNDLTNRLEKEPRLKGEAASVLTDLRTAASDIAGDATLAAAAKTPQDAQGIVHWSHISQSVSSAAGKLDLLCEVADNDFLQQHGSEPAIADAITKIKATRRADLAYAALTGKSRDLPRSLADVFQKQSTHVLTFAGGQQIVAATDKSEIPKAIRAGIEPAGTATNIKDALKFVSDQIPGGEPATVLLVSDGRINEGGDPTEVVQRLAARNVRVFTLGVGSQTIAPDAAVDSIDAPDWIYKDDTLKVTAQIRFDGLAHKTAKIDFLRGATTLESISVTPEQEQFMRTVTFKDKPPGTDVYEYHIRVEEMPGEVVKTNNEQSFRVTVKDDKVHVLIVEEQPRFEYRYLVNYLLRDRRVQLQQVLLQSAHIAGIDQPAKVKASAASTVDRADILPESAEEWSAFDLIVLGDVPTEFLSPETQKNIATAVRERGATLMVIAGQLNMPFHYGGSPLAELLPVRLSSPWSTTTLEDHRKNGFRPAIAPEGVDSVLTQLDPDPQHNTQFWEAMGSGDPKGYWHGEQTQAKPSATVYWMIKDLRAEPTSNADIDVLAEARQRALLATMPVGLGRVLYLSSDSMWRLRQVNGANLNDRFWGQVIRWVVQSDMPAGGRFVRFGTTKPRYTAGEPVVVNVRVLNPDFTPMADQHFKVVARSVLPKDPATGKVVAGPIVATADVAPSSENTGPESAGRYTATLNDIKPGGIQISLEGNPVQKILADDTSTTQKTLFVDVLNGDDLELRNVNADHGAMTRIARSGGGISADAAYGDILAQHIPTLDHPQDSVETIGLFADPSNKYVRYAHWGFLAAFVTLITAEWILRKVAGLV